MEQRMTDKSELKRLTLFMTLGMCEALRAGVATFDEAQYYLFLPRTMALFPDDEEMLHILRLGSELAAVSRIIPQDLDASIAEIKTLAETALSKTSISYQDDERWLEMLATWQRP
jgi:hypothetical protein